MNEIELQWKTKFLKTEPHKHGLDFLRFIQKCALAFSIKIAII